MTRYQIFALTAAMAAFATPAAAQTRMTLKPESKIVLEGSSNVHDWACRTSAFEAAIELDSTYQITPLAIIARPITRVSVTIPVKTLKCGNGKMDDNMYKALKADQFPDITYVLSSYEMDKAKSTDDSFAARTTGQITVSGKTVPVEIPITAVRGAGGSMKGEGVAKLLMTDFGIKPPVALLGTLRTRNELEIKFEVLLDKSVVVALMPK
jgi:polyisoprenoid-binding protein YceI